MTDQEIYDKYGVPFLVAVRTAENTAVFSNMMSKAFKREYAIGWEQECRRMMGEREYDRDRWGKNYKECARLQIEINRHGGEVVNDDE